MLLGRNMDRELKGDLGIWVVLIILSLFSLLAVYSSTGSIAHTSNGGDVTSYLINQIIFLGFGFIITYIVHLMPYMKFAKLGRILLVIAVILLIYTMFFGEVINHASRWIRIPIIGLTFQTSEFAKLALIIYLAREISDRQDNIKSFRDAFVPIIIPILIVCGLIAPSNLSTSLLIFFTGLTMMFMGRLSLKWLAILVLFGIVLFGVIIALGYFFPDYVRVGTWINRLSNFRGTGVVDDYQVSRAKMAIANGGWFGLGPGNSIQRNFIPYPYADFIFAIICEEYGIFGAFAVLSLFALFFVRCFILVLKSPKAFGAILAMGLCLNITIQALANMAVAVNVMPVTGVSLPLISKGGSSLFFMSISFGIILSVSKFIEDYSSKVPNPITDDQTLKTTQDESNH